jgi:hypothetical protein
MTPQEAAVVNAAKAAARWWWNQKFDDKRPGFGHIAQAVVDTVRALPTEAPIEVKCKATYTAEEVVAKQREAFVAGCESEDMATGTSGEDDCYSKWQAEALRRFPDAPYKPKQDADVLPLEPNTGCTCDVNSHGCGWINPACPVHGKPQYDILDGLFHRTTWSREQETKRFKDELRVLAERIIERSESAIDGRIRAHAEKCHIGTFNKHSAADNQL